MNDQSQKIDTRLALIEKDVDLIKILCEKLEQTIVETHKLQTDISTILKLQEMKIQIEEKDQKELQDEIEEYRKDSLKQINLHIRDDVKFRDDFYFKLEKIIEDKNQEQQKEMKDLSKRLSRLERLSWLIIGGFAVISFEIGFFDMLSKLF